MSTPPGPGPLRFHTAVTYDDRVIGEIARSSWRALLLRGPLAFLAFVLIALGSVLALGVTHQVFPVLLVAAACLLTPLFLYLQLRNSARRVHPPGSVVEAWFHDDDLRFRGPFGDTRLQYRAFDRVRPMGRAVGLRQTGNRQWALYPADMFPAPVFEFVRDRIESPHR